jgi:hypothetical protein
MDEKNGKNPLLTSGNLEIVFHALPGRGGILVAGSS